MTKFSPAEQRAMVAVERWNHVTEKSAEVIAGIFKAPHEEGYNPDATATKAECSMRTWTALEIMKQERADHADNRADTRAFASVILQSKLEKTDWEKMAQRIDRMSREKALGKPVIDAVAELVTGK